MKCNLPIHFEFNQYLSVFDTIRELWICDIDVDLVVSTHPYTSGYWVELPGGKTSESDIAYKGVNDIKAFEKRLINELSKSAKEERSARFTI